MASLSNVILLHVSTACLPRTDKQRKKQEQLEYYAVLGLPKYAPAEEIRKAYRRLSLRMRCDRMTAASIGDERERKEEEAAMQKLETRVKEAFRILGDKHLRQQYHLLQCSQARYSVIRGSKRIHDKIISSTYSFPYIMMQSVLLAAMVNTVVDGRSEARWVMVLLPTWVCYGIVVLFWFCRLELPRIGHLHSFWTMLACFAQHAVAWLGLFSWAWYMDGDMPDYWTWHMVALPFYVAILFRSFCTVQAVRTLKNLQSVMVSREFLEQQQFTSEEQGRGSGISSTPCCNMTSLEANNIPYDGEAGNVADPNPTNGEQQESEKMKEFIQNHIIVTVNPRRVRSHLRQLAQIPPHKGVRSFTNEEVETVRVQLSAEFAQADQAARSLTKAITKLIILGASFLLLLACKLQGQLDVSFWIIFVPLWVYFASRIFGCCEWKRRNRNGHRRIPEQDETTSRHGEDSIIIAAPLPNGGTENQIDEETGIVTMHSIATGIAPGEQDAQDTELIFGMADPLTERANGTFGEERTNTPFEFASNHISRNLAASRHESSDGQHGDDEEFERWQAVYEHTETRGVRFYSVSLSVLFQLLIVVLIVVKLQIDFAKEDPTGFNAFFIILIPFTVALALCCCGVTIGCIELAREGLAPNNVDGINIAGQMGEDNQAAQEEDPEAPPPMQAGATKSLTFSTDINTHMPDLTTQQRITILVSALPISIADAEGWLSAYTEDQRVQNSTMWELVVACAESLQCTGINSAEILAADIEFLSLAWLSLLRRNLEAHFERVSFQAKLNAIQPVAGVDLHLAQESERVKLKELPLEDEAGTEATLNAEPAVAISSDSDSVGDDTTQGKGPVITEDNQIEGQIEIEKAGSDDQRLQQHHGGGEQEVVNCLVCCEEYNIADVVYCEGTPIHFFCKGCFYRYATESVQTGGISGMPCAEVTCDFTFATSLVRENVSGWDILRIEDRENEWNIKVALAAKATLHCECGAVAIVTEEDMGDGCISCPGCRKEYCAVCGNFWHPDTNCPPTKKVLQWMIKNTMPCPNCHSPIEKNAGCDHMHCAPPGGCGHHFSYRTGKPMSKTGRNLRGLYN